MRRSLIYFIAAALIMIILGGFAGWYLHVRQGINATVASDSARGFSSGVAGFGTSANTSNQFGGGSISSTTSASSPGKLAPRLWHAYLEPVAGFGFASSSTALYFAVVANGNVYQARPEASAITRLTDTLIPKVAEALLDGDGSVILRTATGNSVQTYAGTIASTTAKLDATSTPAHLQGLYLAPGITSIARAPKKTLVYTVADPASGSVIVQTNELGGAQKKLFTSPFSSWRVFALTDGTLILATRSVDTTPGFAFKLEKDGSLTPILENVIGLTILPRAGGALLYGSSDGTLALYAKTSLKATSAQLPIQTSADKCVWAPGPALIAYCAVPQNVSTASYLLDRYRGALHTADLWYRVDVSAGTASPLYTPDNAQSFDVDAPAIDAAGGSLAFRDATDQSLWMLRLTQ